MNESERKTWQDLIKEVNQILDAYSEPIPFGNSHVQNLLNLTTDEGSPARRLRAYLLRLWDRKRALDEAIFNLKKTEIKLKKLHLLLEKETDELEKELLEIKIEKQLNDLRYTKKMFYDCVQEILILCKAIKEFEPISREEFERQEFEHFSNRLLNMLQYPVELRTLQNLGIEVKQVGDKLIAELSEPKIEETIKKVKEVTEEIKSLPPALNEMIIALKGEILKELPNPETKEEEG